MRHLIAASLALFLSFVGNGTAFANQWVKYLESLPMDERIVAFGEMAGCSSTGYFYKGLGNEGEAFYGVLCEDGEHILLKIEKSDEGTTTMAECDVIRRTVTDCFYNRFEE